MSKLNNMWQKIWGKQMNQIVEKVEHITANGKHTDQGSVKDGTSGPRKFKDELFLVVLRSPDADGTAPFSSRFQK